MWKNANSTSQCELCKFIQNRDFPKEALHKILSIIEKLFLQCFGGFAAMRPLKSRLGGKKGTNVVIFYLDVVPELGIYVGLLRG